MTSPARIWDVVERLEEDWIRLTRDDKITESSAYVHHNGKPVVALWGIGFADRPITISQSQNLLGFFKANATVIGGVPAYWRTLDKDSRKEAGWAEVYRSFDIISPWTVGRFLNRREADDFITNVMLPDIAEVKRYGVEYMPVIFPGYSRYNAANGKEIAFNRILRDCGNFYSHLAHAEIKTGTTMLYTAMFDEVNEGTAIFKVAAVESEIPVGAKLVKLNDNHCNVATDTYLKLAGSITRLLRAAVHPN